MPGISDLVKLCQISQVLPAYICNADGTTTPIKEVVIIDANGAMIPHGDTTYPIPVASSPDASGFVRSYFTDLAGAVVAEPPVWSYDANCGNSDIDLEVSCFDDGTGTITPGYVVENGDGTQTWYDVDGNVLDQATYTLQPECGQFDLETVGPLCVRDATGNIVATVARTTVYDTSTTPPTEVSTQLIDITTNLVYTLGAGEVVGTCDLELPLMEAGCLIDSVAVPPTYTPVYQVIPAVNGAYDVASATYEDQYTGADVVPTADQTFRHGQCPSATCYTCQ